MSRNLLKEKVSRNLEHRKNTGSGVEEQENKWGRKESLVPLGLVRASLSALDPTPNKMKYTENRAIKV